MSVIYAVALAALGAVDAVASIYDANETSKGIKAGVGVENNGIIKALSSNKPSNLFLQAYGIAFIGIVAALSLFLVHQFPGQNIEYVAIGGSLVALPVDALKHLQAGLKWRFMLKGGALDFDGFPIPADGKQVGHSAWQKFIGPWIW